MNGKSVITKGKENGDTFITSLQINDMFIIGLKDEQIDWDNPDMELINDHLYRVENISSMYYNFRKHTASNKDNPNQLKRIQSLKSWLKENAIKVKIDVLGIISPI